MFDAIFPKEWTTLQRLMWLKTNALARAVYETISGNPVSFTAKAAPLRQLEVAFSPLQDLHGYDAPWPAGGGKNKIEAVGEWNVSGTGVVTRETNYTAVIAKIKQGQEYTFSKSGTAVSPQCMGFYSEYPAVGSVSYNSQRILPNSGTFTAPIDGYVLARMNTTQQTGYQLEAGSSATSYVPFENLCPISGWDSLNVWDTGINLFDEEWEQGSIGENGQNYPSATSVRSKSYIPVKNGAHAYIGWDTAESGSVYALIYAYKADKTFSRYIKAVIAPTILTINNDECYIRFFLYNRTTPLTDAFVHLKNNLPHQPYNPSSRSISITIGSTVYSGYVDVVTGVGEITHQMVTLVGGESETWGNYNATYGGYRLTLSDAKIDGLPIDQLKSNLFVPNQYRGVMAEWKPYYLVTYNNKADSTMVFFTTSLTDKSEWLAWLAANPTQLVYPLATPIPIQLTPQEVQSLAGDNTMWSNANQPITVEYRKN